MVYIAGSTMQAAQDYWGYLINSDKSPAPLLEQLLLGIANYIVCCGDRFHSIKTS